MKRLSINIKEGIKEEEEIISDEDENNPFFTGKKGSIEIPNYKGTGKGSENRSIREGSKSFQMSDKFEFLNVLRWKSNKYLGGQLKFKDDNVSLYDESSNNEGELKLEIFSDNESFIANENDINNNNLINTNDNNDNNNVISKSINKKIYISDNSIINQDKYTFKKTYINLLKQFKSSSLYSRFSNVINFKLLINVGDYSFNEGLIFTYVNYEIEGEKNGEDFELFRRYSEFAVYRKLLRLNWPGVYIPFLPPKKSYGNLDETFISVRKKFLQSFCNKICSSPHLASSNATKIFLEPKNENFGSFPIELYQRSIEDIYKIYSRFFGFLLEKKLTQEEKNSVQNFFVSLTKTRKSLDDLIILATEAKNIQVKAQNSLVNFYENNYNVEDALYDMFHYDQDKKKTLCDSTIEISTTEGIFQIKHDNFFTTCFDWTASVSDDFSAMIECISSLYELKQQFYEKFNEIQNKNKSLKSFVNQSFIKKFFFPTNLNQVQQLINDIKELKKDIVILKKLIDLIYKVIYFIEMPTFKRDMYNYYLELLKKLNEDESHVQRKNKLIYNLFKSKCEQIMKTYIEESKKYNLQY